MNERPTVVEGLRRRVQRALSATEKDVSVWAVGALIERTADGEARLRGQRTTMLEGLRSRLLPYGAK